jgi:hypothetical protein
MKRDKWFLNSPSKWNMLKGLKNIYDWYLIFTFPTTIFFKSPCSLLTRTSFFSGDFQGQEGCALCNPKYGTHFVLIHLQTWLPQAIPVLDWSVSKNLLIWNCFAKMNWYLVGSTYGRFCIKFPQSRMKGEWHRLSPLSL